MLMMVMVLKLRTWRMWNAVNLDKRGIKNVFASNWPVLGGLYLNFLVWRRIGAVIPRIMIMCNRLLVSRVMSDQWCYLPLLLRGGIIKSKRKKKFEILSCFSFGQVVSPRDMLPSYWVVENWLVSANDSDTVIWIQNHPWNVSKLVYVLPRFELT